MKARQEICIEALNLKTRKLNGYKLLTVYSKEYGVLKLTGSKLGGRSEPFVHNYFYIVFGKEDIHKIVQTEFIGHFSKLNSNLERMAHAWQYADFLEACTEGQDEKSAQIFDLLFHSLKALEESENNFEDISLQFLWQLSIFLGYKPNLSLCGLGPECHLQKNINQDNFPSAFFDFESGGILCLSCPSQEVIGSEAVKILPGIYKALLALEKGKMSENLKINKFLLSLLQRYLQKHSCRKLKSLEIFSQILL